MAKKQAVELETGSEVVDDLHPTVMDDSVEFTDVTGKDDLPEGVTDVTEEEDKPVRQKPAAKKAVPAAGDDIPPELKGKTVAELAKMYREAQGAIGRQGTELGELRRIADNYIRTNLKAAPAVPVKNDKAEPPDAVSFFTDPAASIAQAVANHPTVKALEGAQRDSAAREMTRQRTESLRQFTEQHPDAPEIVADPEFRAWVVKSPIRQAMLLRAHRNYDLQSGNEIFNTWKELKAARTGVGDGGQPKPQQKGTLKTPADKEAARVPSGGNASPRVSGTRKEGKIFRRADVIRLMGEDPDRYAMMADEITKAYAEGRVR